MNPEKYVRCLYRLLMEGKAPEEAFFMAKYMKNQFQFFGIKKPRREELEKKFFSQYGHPDVSDVPAVIHLLWELPERECQYVGLDLMEKSVKELNPGHLELLEYCIVTKPWWDTVDLIATRLVGTLFRQYPEQIVPCNQRWMKSENLWLKRTCLLFQLKYKDRTDRNLLGENILHLAGEKDFFIRKAIGWALREYSKTDPDWVVQWVKHNLLSSLSEREALRGINRRK